MSITVRMILAEKGRAVVTAKGDTSISEIATILHQNRIGAVVIVGRNDSIVGIFTERDLVEAPAGASFVVVDREGMAVACELTNYYPFGIGRVAEGTGIIPAAAPTGRGRNPLSIGPAVAVDATSFAFDFAIASVGGAFSQATTTQLAADVLLRGLEPRQAMARPRILGVDAPNLAVVESGAPAGGEAAALVEALRISGHEVGDRKARSALRAL